MFHRYVGRLEPAISGRSLTVTLRSTSSSLLRTSHGYATQNSIGGLPTTKRKQVTVVNDDGRVQWGALSLGEKAARITQQTFNFGIILAGLVMTVQLPPPIMESSPDKSREGLRMFYTPTSLRQTARSVTSIELLTRSNPILER